MAERKEADERPNDAQDDAAPAPAERPPAKRRPRRARRWLRRGALTVIVLAGLYSLFGFYGVPALIKRVGVPRFSDRLRGEASLDHAAFNPFTLALRLEGVGVDDEAGRRVAGFERFEGNFQLLATLFQDGYHFRRSVLTRPDALAELGPDGLLNLQTLVIEAPPKAPDQEPIRAIPRIVIDELAIVDARGVFRDASLREPFEKRLEQFDFTIEGFDTAPAHENAFTIVASLAGGAAIAWDGSIYFNPLTASGEFAVTGLGLSDFAPYAAEFSSLRPEQGQVSVEVAYEFAPVRAGRRASLSLRRLLLEDLIIQHPESQMLDLPRLELTGLDADADARTISIEAATAEGASVTLVREPSGALRGFSLVRAEPSRPPSNEREAPASDAGTTSRPVDVQSIEYPLVQLAAAIDALLADVADDWTLDIAGVEVVDGRVLYTDHAAPFQPPAEADISSLHITAGPVHSSEGFRTPLTIVGVMGDGSPVRVEGEVRPMEFALDVRVEGEGVSLSPAARYLPQDWPGPVPPARLASGDATLDGRLRLTIRDNEPLDVSWEGAMHLGSLDAVSTQDGASLLSLGDLGLDGAAGVRFGQGGPAIEWDGEATLRSASLDATIGQPMTGGVTNARIAGALRVGGDAAGPRFQGDIEASGLAFDAPEMSELSAGASTVRLTGVDYDSAQETLALEQASFGSPRLRMRTALTPQVTGAPSAGSDASGSPAAVDEGARVSLRAALPFLLRLDRLSVADGEAVFFDPSLADAGEVRFEGIETEASGVVSDGATSAEFVFTSRVQGSGSVRVEGAADAFREPPFADVQVDLSSVPLPAYSELTAPRLGFTTERGRLNLTLPIRAEEGRLDGQLDALLADFHLGERVDAPQAPDVPLKFGLNLLRNRNDEISLNVPISGDMTDPKFSLDSVISQAFFNLVGRVATSPFRALAAAIGGGEDIDLSKVVFEPGSARLSPDALRTVDALGRALYQRPALTLTATGVYDPVADRGALRRNRLEERLLARAETEDPSVIRLNEARRRAAMEALFAERFPDRVPIRVPVPPGARDQARVPLEEMERSLLADIIVTEDQLQSLARRRVEAAVKIIVEEAGVEPERVAIADPRPAEDDEAPRVLFDLSAR